MASGEYIRRRYEHLLNSRQTPERVQVNASLKKNSAKGDSFEKKPMKRTRTVDFSFKKDSRKPVRKIKSEYNTTASKNKQREKNEGEWLRTNPLPTSASSVKLAHQLRLAVHLGGGNIDPDENPQLRNILRETWELGMPQEEIHRILKQCKLGTNKLNSYKLQIRFGRNIYMICCVQVGQLLSAKKKLTPILKEFNASFHYAMDLFKNVGLIEAFIKPATTFDFEEFDTIVRTDAQDCKARALEVIDYSTGSVCFSCNPLYLLNVVKGLQSKGYEIVYTENGYRANLLVDISWLDRSTYAKFIGKLYELDEITHVYDNVRNIDIPYEPIFDVKV